MQIGWFTKYYIVHLDIGSCSNLPCDHWYPNTLQNLAEPVCNIKGNCYRLKEYGGHSKHAFSSCDGKICRYSGICYSLSSVDDKRTIQFKIFIINIFLNFSRGHDSKATRRKIYRWHFRDHLVLYSMILVWYYKVYCNPTPSILRIDIVIII